MKTDESVKKISVGVVVPVYNEIENIDRCIDSLICQTYDNYVILLVDDGSTDGSGVRCDSYARDYENIEVIHQKNGGLSAARNAGTQNIKTEYVTYVDSDDYVSPYLLEDLVGGIINNDADMAIIHMKVLLNSNDNIFVKESVENRSYVYDPETALKHMCYKNQFGVSACGKMIKKELAVRYPFPEGKLYEDLATTYKWIGDCDKIVYIDTADYYYIQYQGVGITRGVERETA